MNAASEIKRNNLEGCTNIAKYNKRTHREGEKEGVERNKMGES